MGGRTDDYCARVPVQIKYLRVNDDFGVDQFFFSSCDRTTYIVIIR